MPSPPSLHSQFCLAVQLRFLAGVVCNSTHILSTDGNDENLVHKIIPASCQNQRIIDRLRQHAALSILNILSRLALVVDNSAIFIHVNPSQLQKFTLHLTVGDIKSVLASSYQLNAK